MVANYVIYFSSERYVVILTSFYLSLHNCMADSTYLFDKISLSWQNFGKSLIIAYMYRRLHILCFDTEVIKEVIEKATSICYNKVRRNLPLLLPYIVVTWARGIFLIYICPKPKGRRPAFCTFILNI